MCNTSGAKPIYLNRWQLWRSGACESDRKLFKRTFGWRAEVTQENFDKAVKAGLSVGFFIRHCRMSGEMRRALKLMALESGAYVWF